MDIIIKDLDDLLANFWRLDPHKTLQKAMKKSVLTIQREAIKETPVDTWLLRNSYEIFYGNLEWKLINTRKYWVYVHEWTKYIKWNPFLTRAADKSEEKVNKIFNKEVTKMINSLND